MNSKGFTLIEMLAVVVILGVLGTIAVVGTTKYIKGSRNKAYIIMSESVYEAAMNGQTNGKYGAGISINTNKLIQDGYLDELKNPISKNNDCFGNVKIIESSNSNNSEYKKYQYKVTLECPGLEKRTITWPDYKSNG